MSEVNFSTVPAQLREPAQGDFRTTQSVQDRIEFEGTPAERAGRLRQDRDFAPRRREREKSVIVTETEPPKPQESLSANAARVATMVDDLQKDRDQLARRLSDALARIEQFEISTNDLASRIETSRIALDEEKGKRIKLGTILRAIRSAMDETIEIENDETDERG